MSLTVSGKVAPLFFRYRELLVGSGFLASVTTTGRVLCVEEPNGEFWMYGVQPGGVADWGETVEAAHAAFRRAFHAVLIDIAKEAGTPDEFSVAVRDFVNTTNEPTAAMWDEAVQQVRSGAVDTPGLERWPSSTPVQVEVAIMREPRPEANILEDTLQHAVAA